MTAQTEASTEQQEYLGIYGVWWHRLTYSSRCKTEKWMALPTAHKAILRKCKSIDEVLMTEPFQHLWLTLPEAKRTPKRMPLVAMLAWLLANVKTDGEKTLPKAMAERTTADSESPKVSQLRFQQLINAKSPEDFNRRMRRILTQINGTVSVPRFASDVENWYWQTQLSTPPAPEKRQTLRWAMDYYQALPGKKA